MTGHEAVDGSSAADEGQVEEPVRGRVDEEEAGEVVQPGLVKPHHDVHLWRKKLVVGFTGATRKVLMCKFLNLKIEWS